jgi:hypothetical protein
VKHQAEIREKISEAFERALDHGPTIHPSRTVAKPESLAEKSERLVEQLKNDPYIFLSPHGEVHTVRVPEKLQAPNTHLDIRCAGLYEQAVRALRKEKQR